MTGTAKTCPFCGAVMDRDSEGVPAHPAPVCTEFMTQDGEVIEEDGRGCE